MASDGEENSIVHARVRAMEVPHARAGRDNSLQETRRVDAFVVVVLVRERLQCMSMASDGAEQLSHFQVQWAVLYSEASQRTGIVAEQLRKHVWKLVVQCEIMLEVLISAAMWLEGCEMRKEHWTRVVSSVGEVHRDNSVLNKPGIAAVDGDWFDSRGDAHKLVQCKHKRPVLQVVQLHVSVKIRIMTNTVPLFAHTIYIGIVVSGGRHNELADVIYLATSQRSGSGI